jgi:hypothetical protein
MVVDVPLFWSVFMEKTQRHKGTKRLKVRMPVDISLPTLNSEETQKEGIELED